MIDAVITWVDGFDVAHREKLETYLKQHGITRPESAAATRYNQCGELTYCIKSIFYFAPWVRTIFIITDAQYPSILDEIAGTSWASRVRVIDHRDIFKGYEQYLPSFNSLSIETFLWRIDSLSNQFIYFNDDCFLVRKVLPEDFFCGERLVLRGNWKSMSRYTWRYYCKRLCGLFSKTLATKFERGTHRLLQEKSAYLAGFHKKFYCLPHVPFPLDKRQLQRCFQENESLFVQNIQYPFRDPIQFWLISLSYHLAIRDTAVCFEKRTRAARIHGACSLRKIKNNLLSIARSDHLAFLCVQSIDEAPTSTRAWVMQWLDNYFRCTHSVFRGLF